MDRNGNLITLTEKEQELSKAPVNPIDVDAARLLAEGLLARTQAVIDEADRINALNPDSTSKVIPYTVTIQKHSIAQRMLALCMETDRENNGN